VEIPVDRKFRRLHVLHGTAALELDGERVGTYRLHYRGGGSTELPIIYGRDSRDMWHYSTALTDTGKGWAQVSEAELAWICTASQTNPLEHGIRLYRRTYKNPAPEREVTHLTFESNMATSGPFLLALTVEP
jgi:hypothetical protein